MPKKVKSKGVKTDSSDDEKDKKDSEKAVDATGEIEISDSKAKKKKSKSRSKRKNKKKEEPKEEGGASLTEVKDGKTEKNDDKTDNSGGDATDKQNSTTEESAGVGEDANKAGDSTSQSTETKEEKDESSKESTNTDDSVGVLLQQATQSMSQESSRGNNDDEQDSTQTIGGDGGSQTESGKNSENLGWIPTIHYRVANFELPGTYKFSAFSEMKGRGYVDYKSNFSFDESVLTDRKLPKAIWAKISRVKFMNVSVGKPIEPDYTSLTYQVNSFNLKPISDKTFTDKIAMRTLNEDSSQHFQQIAYMNDSDVTRYDESFEYYRLATKACNDTIINKLQTGNLTQVEEELSTMLDEDYIYDIDVIEDIKPFFIPPERVSLIPFEKMMSQTKINPYLEMPMSYLEGFSPLSNTGASIPTGLAGSLRSATQNLALEAFKKIISGRASGFGRGFSISLSSEPYTDILGICLLFTMVPARLVIAGCDALAELLISLNLNINGPQLGPLITGNIPITGTLLRNFGGSNPDPSFLTMIQKMLEKVRLVQSEFTDFNQTAYYDLVKMERSSPQIRTKFVRELSDGYYSDWKDVQTETEAIYNLFMTEVRTLLRKTNAGAMAGGLIPHKTGPLAPAFIETSVVRWFVQQGCIAMKDNYDQNFVPVEHASYMSAIEISTLSLMSMLLFGTPEVEKLEQGSGVFTVTRTMPSSKRIDPLELISQEWTRASFIDVMSSSIHLALKMVSEIPDDQKVVKLLMKDQHKIIRMINSLIERVFVTDGSFKIILDALDKFLTGRSLDELAAIIPDGQFEFEYFSSNTQISVPHLEGVVLTRTVMTARDHISDAYGEILLLNHDGEANMTVDLVDTYGVSTDAIRKVAGLDKVISVKGYPRKIRVQLPEPTLQKLEPVETQQVFYVDKDGKMRSGFKSASIVDNLAFKINELGQWTVDTNYLKDNPIVIMYGQPNVAEKDEEFRTKVTKTRELVDKEFYDVTAVWKPTPVFNLMPIQKDAYGYNRNSNLNANLRAYFNKSGDNNKIGFIYQNWEDESIDSCKPLSMDKVDNLSFGSETSVFIGVISARVLRKTKVMYSGPSSFSHL